MAHMGCDKTVLSMAWRFLGARHIPAPCVLKGFRIKQLSALLLMEEILQHLEPLSYCNS